MKFTFKANRPTGKYRSFFATTHDIKLKGEVVGEIDDNLTIRLMILKKDINEDGNPNCKWKWVKLKKKSSTLEEAKEFLNSNIDKIIELNLKS